MASDGVVTPEQQAQRDQQEANRLRQETAYQDQMAQVRQETNTAPSPEPPMPPPPAADTSILDPQYVIPSSEDLGFNPYENVLPEEQLAEYWSGNLEASANPVPEPPAPEVPFANDWTPGSEYVFDTTPTQPTIVNEPSWTDGVSTGTVNAERQELANSGFVTPEAQQAAMDAAAQVPSVTGSLSEVENPVTVLEQIAGGVLAQIPIVGGIAQDAWLNAAGQPITTRTYTDENGNIVEQAPIDANGLSPDNGTIGGLPASAEDTPLVDIPGYQSSADQGNAPTSPSTPPPVIPVTSTEGGPTVGSGNSAPATTFTARPVVDLTTGYNALNETAGVRDVNWYRSNPFYAQLTQAGGGMNPLTAYDSADAQALLAGNMLGGAATRYAGADPALASAMQAFQAAQAGAAGQAGIQGQALGAMQQGLSGLQAGQQALSGVNPYLAQASSYFGQGAQQALGAAGAQGQASDFLNQGATGLGQASGYLGQAAQAAGAGQGTLTGALGQLGGAQQAAQVGGQQALGQGLFNQGAQLAQEQANAARQGMQAGQQGLAGYQQALNRTPQQQYGSFLGAQQQMLGQAGAAADAATSLFGQSAMAQAAQQSNDARRMMEQRLATSGMLGTQSGAALGAITEAASRPYAEAMTNIAAQRANAFQNAYNPQAQAMLQNTLASPERQLAGVTAGQQVFGQGVQGLGQGAQSLFGAGQGVLSAGQLGLGQASTLGQLAGQQMQIGQAQGQMADRLTGIGQAQGQVAGQYGQLGGQALAGGQLGLSIADQLRLAGQGALSQAQVQQGQAQIGGQLAGQFGQLGQGMLGAGQLGLSMADMQRLAGQGMLSQAAGQQQSAAGLGALGGQYGNLAQLMQQRGNTLADLLSQQSQQALVAPQFQQQASQEDRTFDLLGGLFNFGGNVAGAMR